MVQQSSKIPKRSKKVQKSKPMGRPSLTGKPSQGERSPLIGLRIPESELACVDAFAKRQGVKRSEMVRRLIEAGRKVFDR
jgi:hypothetical protein